MRILVTGNMGYVGPSVIRHLKQIDGAQVIGLDTGFFAHCLVAPAMLPEVRIDEQRFADVRDLRPQDLKGIDAVVYLAAISNDPMGKAFEEVTMEINWRAAIEVARLAKSAGARSFVFASSCSVYGFTEGVADEGSRLDPLTAYARSKVQGERDLQPLADQSFTVSCLRFATACGMSERLRLDLVLNDFVAAAIASREIQILSDGTPWRPLIHVHDMGRAIAWAVQRSASAGGEYLIANVGSEQWNYRVKDLGEAVAAAVSATRLSINQAAPPDRRSYRVSFERFSKLAPTATPRVTLAMAINDLLQGLNRAGFKDAQFRKSTLIRLNMLSELRQREVLGGELRWVSPRAPFPGAPLE